MPQPVTPGGDCQGIAQPGQGFFQGVGTLAPYLPGRVMVRPEPRGQGCANVHEPALAALGDASGDFHLALDAPHVRPVEPQYFFAPQATQDDVTKFLEANKLTIAAGPAAGGFYKVRVAVTGLPKAELANIVKKLQQDKVVGFIATTE